MNVPSHPQVRANTFTGAPATQNHPGQVALREASLYADSIDNMTEQTMERRLQSIGTAWFVDMLSVGYLTEELAMSVGVRISVLARWLNEFAGPDVLLKAKQSAAAYYRIKAIRTVDQRTPGDRVALAHMKLRMEAYRDIAEAMHPTTWAPNTNNAPGLGVAQVTINMPSLTAQGGVQQYGPGVAPIPDAVIIDQTPKPEGLQGGPSAADTSAGTGEDLTQHDAAFTQQMANLLALLTAGETPPTIPGIPAVNDPSRGIPKGATLAAPAEAMTTHPVTHIAQEPTIQPAPVQHPAPQVEPAPEPVQIPPAMQVFQKPGFGAVDPEQASPDEGA